MLSATGSTGSLKAHACLRCERSFLMIARHCFCHCFWPPREEFHSHWLACDFSNSLISVLLSGRRVPSGSSLTSLYAWKELRRSRLFGASGWPVYPGGLHTSALREGNGRGEVSDCAGRDLGLPAGD